MSDRPSEAQLLERVRWSNLVDPSPDAMTEVKPDPYGNMPRVDRLSQLEAAISSLTIRIAAMEEKIEAKIEPKDEAPIHAAIRKSEPKPMVGPMGSPQPK